MDELVSPSIGYRSDLNRPVISIVQSCYIPWKGYFDLINMSDTFVLFDEVQYTRRDWRNRNKIKTASGLKWLTIPVQSKGNFEEKISQIRVDDESWAKRHWQTIIQVYSRAPYFNYYREKLAHVYQLASQLTHLSEINKLFLTEICRLLEIETAIVSSCDFALKEGKSERLLGLCQNLSASTYLSGPAAKDYLDESIFHEAGISVAWADYSGYPVYNQLYEPFEHGVTVLDLLFMTGPEYRRYMNSFCIA